MPRHVALAATSKWLTFMWRGSTLAMASALPPNHHVAIDSIRYCNIRGGCIFPRRSLALPITTFDEKWEKVIDVWLTFRTTRDLRWSTTIRICCGVAEHRHASALVNAGILTVEHLQSAKDLELKSDRRGGPIHAVLKRDEGVGVA